MIQAVHAIYGVKNNSHSLLSADVDLQRLPTELLGLTDQPPGGRSGDAWWPSVGCGPVGDWWAIWWTVPDGEAQRGGMVHSQVLLWPLDSALEEVDLFSALKELGGVAIPKLDQLNLLLLANALIDSCSQPVIVIGVGDWPSFIASLWEKLWPKARRSFSARLAISPPQGGESVSPPWIYCIPEGYQQQWQNSDAVLMNDEKLNFNRATLWLVEQQDIVFDEVLKAITQKPSKLSELSKISRAADRLENMRHQTLAKSALDFLRTIISLIPQAEVASELKLEAIGILSNGLKKEDSSFPLMLANIKEINLPTQSVPSVELSIWIENNLTQVDVDCALEYLHRIDGDKSEPWWGDAVIKGIKKILSRPDDVWAKPVIHWLSSISVSEILSEILPSTERIENGLVAAALKMDLEQSSSQLIKKEASKRHWSRLHAAMCMNTATQCCDVFEEHWAFKGDVYPGLTLLAENMQPVEVVTEAVRREELEFTSVVANMTSTNPDAMVELDVRKIGWRKLWIAHINDGGDRWPDGVNKANQIGTLLSLHLNNEDVESLIVELSSDIASDILCHLRFDEIWEKLSNNSRNSLLDNFVLSVIQQCASGVRVERPNQEIVNSLIAYVDRHSVSTKVFSRLLSWGSATSERMATSWLWKLDKSDWIDSGRDIGRMVLSKSWENTATEIYELSKKYREATVAARECKSLLSWWARLKLGDDDSASFFKKEELSRRLGELGAELAHDQLDGIWERAGGQIKDLKGDCVRPSERWFDAVNQASNGKIEGGMNALFDELAREFPNNSDLGELRRLVND
ncbi:hypothetical protein MNBD_ALPHA03-1211 [hydrothermal vent metagenome]|uniref:Uncharacterized protein n=1 Tax=hydrothermal vent metagenome TaxID=652676 RepID=A0A3B1AGR2_9ZZZZ